MRRIRKAFFAKPLSLYFAAALLAVSANAGPAEAMYLSSDSRSVQVAQPADRITDMAALQKKTLETEVIRQRLADYVLSSHGALAKLSPPSDNQVYQLATGIEAVQAGSHRGGIDATSLIIMLLLVVLIVILIENIAVPKSQVGRPLVPVSRCFRTISNAARRYSIGEK